MSVQAANVGGNVAEVLSVIVKQATDAITTILKKGPNADVTAQVDGIVAEVRKLDNSGFTLTVPPSPYASPNLPHGYQTVMGYMYEQNPALIDMAVE